MNDRFIHVVQDLVSAISSGELLDEALVNVAAVRGCKPNALRTGRCGWTERRNYLRDAAGRK